MNLSSGYNYPPGFHGGIERTDNITLYCQGCGHEWQASMFFELGGWFYDNDDHAFCPHCGEEGKEKPS